MARLRRTWTLMLAAIWIVLVVVLALGAGWLPVPSPDVIDPVSLSASPSAGHFLGTDAMGRDIASRLLFGARVSLTVGFCAPLIGLLIGLLLGVPAGYYGGWTGKAVSFLVDVLLAFPGLVFLLVFTFTFGNSLTTITIGLGILTAPRFTRVARAATVRYAGREFVVAARASGSGDVAVLLREILPNIIGSLIVYLLVVAGFVIIAEGGLGFLGLSVPSPTPSWGGMIAEGRDALDSTPHVSMIPMAIMFATILAVNVIGDAARSARGGRERVQR